MVRPIGRFELVPRGPFSLAASIRFLEGFAPAAYAGDGPDHLDLAFVADGGEAVAGVRVRERDGLVVGDVFGEAPLDVVRGQVARVLSLDIDGTAFPAVGRRDPTVGRLQARYPGLRPVGFCSPYEAAAWALIGHRIRVTQAAKIKARLAEELGPAVAIHDTEHRAFPGPARLAELDAVPGLTERKVGYLRALGEAAAAGHLDAATLRSLPEREALARLRALPGIGPFSAELTLLRGACPPDGLPRHEGRLPRAVALAYGRAAPPDAEELEQLAEPWRPYRTWVALLLRTMLEDETHEIAGR